jgi:hypothetical protein
MGTKVMGASFKSPTFHSQVKKPWSTVNCSISQREPLGEACGGPTGKAILLEDRVYREQNKPPAHSVDGVGWKVPPRAAGPVGDLICSTGKLNRT